MKTKTVGRTWKLKSGLLYAGLDGLMSTLVGPDDALVFDSRDNPKTKLAFWNAVLHVKFEIEFCNGPVKN